MRFSVKTIRKLTVSLLLLCMVLSPVAIAGSPVRTYAAGANHEEISSTAEQDAEAEAVLQDTAVPEQTLPAKTEEKTEGTVRKTEAVANAVDALSIPEVKEARAQAEAANEAMRAEKDKAWSNLKDAEEAKAKAEEEKKAAEAAAAAKKKSGSVKSAAPAEEHLVDAGDFWLTAYCPCFLCTGGWGGRTSSGVIARSNHTIATDPSVIPSGTKVKINGKTYVAEDTGSGVEGNHIDIFFDEHETALEFGSRHAHVYIMK